MKKLFMLLFCAGIGWAAFSQPDETAATENEETSDGDKIIGGGSRDRLVAEINWNWLLDAPEELNLRPQSRGFNIYGYYDIKLGGDKVGFAPGLGVATANYYHEAIFSIGDSTTGIVPIPDSLEFKKNKLSLTYLELPVELRFRTKLNAKGNRFKFAAGFKAGYLIGSHTKYRGDDYGVFNDGQDEIKLKRHGIENLSKFRYGVTARIGYGVFNLHVYYGLSNLFEADKGPAGTPLEVGISFNAF